MTSKTVKYIATGFLEDAGKLLNDFVEKNSTDFSEFTEVWRKHHFSLIFMGRPDHVETTEFINEIFKLSSRFLSSPSFYQKVGAVYLLYSLFQTQISIPPIKIRLEITHWRIINTLRVDAILNKHYTLLYVIDFLIKNAFLYVARQMLKGPVIGCMQKPSKYREEVSAIKAIYKTDALEYSVSNTFETLMNLHADYLAEKQNLIDFEKLSFEDTSTEVYQMFDSNLQKLVNPEVNNKKNPESVGSRRAKIKAQSFIRKTLDRFGKVHEENGYNSDSNGRDTEYGNFTMNAKRTRRTRGRKIPKEHRKVGRPSKYKKAEEKPVEVESSDEVNINHLLSQQQELYLPPEETAESIKRKTKRDPYYKLSPKREKLSSDSDDPVYL